MNGDGPLTFEYWIGRISEEFGGALPTAVMEEVDRLPSGMLEQIIQDRAIARAIRVYQQDPKATGDILVDLVRLVDFELAQEAIDAQQLHG